MDDCSANYDVSINEFNKMRDKDLNVNAMITSIDNEEKDLFFYHNKSAINTISKDLADKRLSKPKKIIRLKGKTLNTIIEESIYKDKKINLLSIDIENYEYEALKNFNFEKYNIDVIVSEITDLSQSNLEVYNQSLDYILETNLYKLLMNNNYKLINWVNADLIFFNKDSKI